MHKTPCRTDLEALRPYTQLACSVGQSATTLEGLRTPNKTESWNAQPANSRCRRKTWAVSVGAEKLLTSGLEVGLALRTLVACELLAESPRYAVQGHGTVLGDRTIDRGIASARSFGPPWDLVGCCTLL